MQVDKAKSTLQQKRRTYEVLSILLRRSPVLPRHSVYSLTTHGLYCRSKHLEYQLLRGDKRISKYGDHGSKIAEEKDTITA